MFEICRAVICAIALTAGALITDVRAQGAAPGATSAPVWVKTGSMRTPRAGHTATLLHDGRVLVAGGYVYSPDSGTVYLDSAEIFDPAAGAWTPARPMPRLRANHFAFLLSTGAILVVGGYLPCCSNVLSAEVYDPSTGKWSGLPDGPAISSSAATMLPDGRVAVIGTPYNESSESTRSPLVAVLDPLRQTWVTGPRDPAPREAPSATALPNGSILVYGGSTSVYGVDAPGAELYDPAVGAWRMTGAPNVLRHSMSGVVLTDGSVLVAGGWHPDEDIGTVRVTDVYGPDGVWRRVGDLRQSRLRPTFTMLRDGHVLAVGGATASVELYDPATGTWSTTTPLTTVRTNHTATLLADGSVLVVGGTTSFPDYRTLATAEIHIRPWPAQGNSAFRITGIFSDQAGVYQYIVLSALDRGASRSLAGRSLRITSRSGVVKTYTFHGDPGTGDSVCIATKGVWPNPGGVDYVMPDRFIPTIGGTLDFSGVDSWTFDEFALTGSAYVDRHAGNSGANGLMTCTRIVVSVTVPVDPVIEYYSPVLDHYFISALQPDIDALDSGRIPGWVRTGHTFNAWITRDARSSNGAAIPANVSDVCRLYIPPALGDSHFYSASPAECAMAKELHPEFVVETSSTFLATLPNQQTGECPAGQVPVYRLWNGRANHRYTTSRAVRSEMIAKQYKPEGYGADGVAMCVAGGG